MDTESLCRLPRVSPLGGGARRIQRQIHVQSNGPAGRVVRDEHQPHPRFVSQLLSAGRPLAVFGNSARENDMIQSPTRSNVVRKVRATPIHDFRTDVLAGLGGSPKSLPCKYFYDAAGTELFDRI